jgi:lysophospholipase L1-like esterase
LLFSITSVFATQIFATQEKKLCIAFGDSIASGYGIDNVSDTYPAIIAKKYGLYCENNAVSGDKSSGMLNVISKTTSIKEAALITISIGGNDLIGNRDIVLAKAVSKRMSAMSLPSKTVEKLIQEINISGLFNGSKVNFETIDADIEKIFSTLHKNLSDSVKLIRSQNKDAIIIVQTLYNPYLNNPEYQIFGFDVGTLIEEYIQKINQTYYAVQKELDETFIIADVASGMTGKSEYFYTSWDFHPTKKGHAHMAQVIGDIYGKSIQTSTTTVTTVTTAATTTAATAATTIATTTATTIATTTATTTTAATTTATTTTTATITTTATTTTTAKTTQITSSKATTSTTTEISTATESAQITQEVITQNSFTNIPTEEVPIPTEDIPDLDGNVKTTVFICIALVGVIALVAGIMIKKNK